MQAQEERSTAKNTVEIKRKHWEEAVKKCNEIPGLWFNSDGIEILIEY